jgi:membrane protein implicated in regulation of membrane protease activity
VSTFIRVGLVVVGILLMLAGLALIVAVQLTVPGLQLVAFGAFLVVVVALERNRYRSETAERSNASPGPGGGEQAGALEARFRATSEVFVDPTSGHRMRVLVDPATGERRYIAET